MDECVLVIAEQREGRLDPMSLETVVAGQRFAAQSGLDLVLALIGKDLEAAPEPLAHADAERLWLVAHPLLEPYTSDAYCLAARALVERVRPAWVFLPHSYQVRDFAPRLAAAFGRSLVSDCIGVRSEDGRPVFVRPMFQGRIEGEVAVVADPPRFVSFQAGAFSAERLVRRPDALPVERLEPELPAEEIRVQAEAPAPGGARDVDLTQAEIIVAVGRGIHSPENVALARELAAALGGELGASRPVCDQGWLPIARQIGSSGQTVAPKLYLALGISGAFQHLVGMRGSHTIVAINTDPHAPIFKVADYGIVGDAEELVPALIAALRDAGRKGPAQSAA